MKVLDFDYGKDRDKTIWCKLHVTNGRKTTELTGTVQIPMVMDHHELGHAIRQLLTDKYGFSMPCVYKPLSEEAFRDAEIFGLHI